MLNKPRKILLEASGSLTAAYLINAVKSAGHLAVASDINDNAYGRYLADEFLEMESAHSPTLWGGIIRSVMDHKIDLVIPSLDETMLGWAERKDFFKNNEVDVIISPRSSIELAQDKWLTYLFFKENNIPTPLTSLEQQYSLIKPRFGRGGVGIYRNEKIPLNMDGMISQEFIEGREFTIDILCDLEGSPIYIVPRERLSVQGGKSINGVVIEDGELEHWVKKICESTQFVGPINIQCFRVADGSVKFLEINPRIAGGMALGFAATENWVTVIIDTILSGKKHLPKPIKYGLQMRRYYAEVFIP